MIKFKFKLSILFLMLVLSLSVLCSFSTIKTYASTEDYSYYLDFEELNEGDISGNNWQFYIYQEKSGVAQNPTNPEQKSLKIANSSDGAAASNWFSNTVSLGDMSKELIVFSCDYYIPAGAYFLNNDQLFFQLRNSSNHTQPYAIYGDCIQSYSSNKTGQTYKSNIPRDKWFTVEVLYYSTTSTYDIVYKVENQEETIASNVA